MVAAAVKVQRVTDFSMIRVAVSQDNWWNLPAEVRRLFEIYARELPHGPNDDVIFEMAAYVWPDIEATMRRIEVRK